MNSFSGATTTALLESLASSSSFAGVSGTPGRVFTAVDGSGTLVVSVEVESGTSEETLP